MEIPEAKVEQGVVETTMDELDFVAGEEVNSDAIGRYGNIARVRYHWIDERRSNFVDGGGV